MMPGLIQNFNWEKKLNSTYLQIKIECSWISMAKGSLTG